MANPKYYRMRLAGSVSICPWCERRNDHRAGNAHCCEHVAKVTAASIVYYYWGFRPVKSQVEA